MNKPQRGHVTIRIHLLFWLVMLLAIAAGYFLETLTLFVIILIHEWGHIAAARELGWSVTEVQLLPFGGVAVMENEAASAPLDEIVVALAGPFLNVVMIFFSLLFWKAGWWTAEWTHFFMTSNWLIAGFNLLPIWPLDGGRILHALLCYWLPYRKAGVRIFQAGMVLSVLLLAMGLVALHVNAVAVAIYLLVMNAHALRQFPYQYIRFLVDKYGRLEEQHTIRPVTVTDATTVLEACQQLRRGYAHMFIVTGQRGGILSEEQLLYALLVLRMHHQPVVRLLS